MGFFSHFLGGHQLNTTRQVSFCEVFYTYFCLFLCCGNQLQTSAFSTRWIGLEEGCVEQRVISQMGELETVSSSEVGPSEIIFSYNTLFADVHALQNQLHFFLYKLLFMLYIVPRVQGNLMLLDSHMKQLKLNWQWSVSFFSPCYSKEDLNLIQNADT